MPFRYFYLCLPRDLELIEDEIRRFKPKDIFKQVKRNKQWWKLDIVDQLKISQETMRTFYVKWNTRFGFVFLPTVPDLVNYAYREIIMGKPYESLPYVSIYYMD